MRFVPSGRCCSGMNCDDCCFLKSGLFVPQGPLIPLSSASFATMMFTQETPHSCIRTLTLAGGSETLSLSLRLHWPASLLLWIARSQVRLGGPGLGRPVKGMRVCVSLSTRTCKRVVVSGLFVFCASLILTLEMFLLKRIWTKGFNLYFGIRSCLRTEENSGERNIIRSDLRT